MTGNHEQQQKRHFLFDLMVLESNNGVCSIYIGHFKLITFSLGVAVIID
jgi:hypothetical protein